VLRIFIALKKSIALAGFEPATFGSSGKHTNHYTTKATRWGETMSLNGGHQRAYCSSARLCTSMEHHGGMILTKENRRTRRRTCPSATFTATNPALTEPDANPGLRGDMPTTNRLTHGRALL
jgi:hypothetical protein